MTIPNSLNSDKLFVDTYNFWKLQYAYRHHIISKLKDIEEIIISLQELSNYTPCKIFKNSVANLIKLFTSTPFMEIIKLQYKFNVCKLIDSKIKIIDGKFKRKPTICNLKGKKYCNVLISKNQLPTYCDYYNCHILDAVTNIVNKIDWLLNVEAERPENYIDSKSVYIDSDKILTYFLIDIQKIYECASVATYIRFESSKNFFTQFMINSNSNESKIDLSKLSITQDGNLTGKLSVDISEPPDGILRKINFLKALKFNTVPDATYLNHCLNIFDIDYTQLKNCILSNKNVAIDPEEYIGRAIGLWLFDNSYNIRGCLSKAINNFYDFSLTLANKYPDISKHNLDGIDESQLRRYYARTKLCIEENEVLSMSYKYSKNKKN